MSDKTKFRLEDFGEDMTAGARAGRYDPVIGRESVIERLIHVLARRTKNNPLLLGEPGVGKSAVVEGVAQRIAAGQVPADLQGRQLFSLNLGNLLAGTGYRGDFEARLRSLVEELRRPGAKRLLFVDEIHLLGKAGKSEGGVDAGNYLKPLLARGELPCIGASTPDEWREMAARDPALERRFHPIDVAEPTPDQAVAILAGLRGRYERHHGVTITDGAIQRAVEISVAGQPRRRLPDKALDLLDEACARVRLRGEPDRPQESAEALQLRRALQEAEERFDFEAVARLRCAAAPKLGAEPIERLRVEADAIVLGEKAV